MLNDEYFLREKGLAAGSDIVHPDTAEHELEQFITLGCQFIALGIDILFLGNSCRYVASKARVVIERATT